MPDIREVSITLTGEQIAAMGEAVKAGEYATTSEIVQEAMDLWQSRRELQRLGQAWDAGKASGPAAPLDFGSLRQEARQRLSDARASGSHAG